MSMSMTERHQKVEELVMQDPRVLDCSHRFCDAQREINEWHVRNNPPSCATMGQLKELDELINYSAFCLEDLKCAKRRAYKQVNTQYPRIWDTSCADPFDTGAQDDTEPGGEATGETDTPADADEAPCTCALCQVLDALDDSECDNLPVTVILVPVHGLLSEYEEE